jgi:hypothetical protein
MRYIAKCLLWAGLNLGLCSLGLCNLGTCRVAFAAVPNPAEAAPVDLDDIELEGRTVAPTPKAALSWKGLLLLHAADGVGAGGQVRYENAGLRASFAYQPQYFVVDKDPWDDEFARFEFANSVQLNVDAFYLFGESEKGASLSYRYSTLLGHGLGVAYQSYVDLAGARLALSIPVIYYPAASERVRSELGLKGDERINFPFGPGVEYGIGVAWLF